MVESLKKPNKPNQATTASNKKACFLEESMMPSSEREYDHEKDCIKQSGEFYFATFFIKVYSEL